MKEIKKTITLYFLLFGVLVASIAQAYSTYTTSQVTVEINPYVQPKLRWGAFPWAVRSVDTQVISKHWPDVSREAIIEQVELLKSLGTNYIAIGTPYDRVDDMRLWTSEIHAAGLHVWFRSHWAEWEGDEGLPSTLSKEDYLTRTREFIVANPDLFAPGDAFTVAVEAEQVGIGLGKRFLNWKEYKEFLLLEIHVANDAFTQIGLQGMVHTNWLSMNGWVLDNQMDQELADQIGLIVVDHYVHQSQTIGTLEDKTLMVDTTSVDLDRWWNRWHKPILLGEWGYHIFQEVSEQRQAEVVEAMFSMLLTKPYLVGVNYWVHMGNPAAIIKDEYGTNLTYRQAAAVVSSFFDPSGNNSLLAPYTKSHTVEPAPNL